MQALYYLDTVTGCRMLVDGDNHLHAPVVDGVTDENIEAIMSRLARSECSSIMTCWWRGVWDMQYTLRNSIITPRSEVPPIWLEQFDRSVG